MMLSDVCLSVAYIVPKSRTERPRKTKIGTEVAHVTRDSDTTFKVKRSKVKVTGAGAYCGGLPPTTCLHYCSHDLPLHSSYTHDGDSFGIWWYRIGAWDITQSRTSHCYPARGGETRGRTTASRLGHGEAGCDISTHRTWSVINARMRTSVALHVHVVSTER